MKLPRSSRCTSRATRETSRELEPLPPHDSSSIRGIATHACACGASWWTSAPSSIARFHGRISDVVDRVLRQRGGGEDRNAGAGQEPPLLLGAAVDDVTQRAGRVADGVEECVALGGGAVGGDGAVPRRRARSSQSRRPPIAACDSRGERLRQRRRRTARARASPSSVRATEASGCTRATDPVAVGAAVGGQLVDVAPGRGRARRDDGAHGVGREVGEVLVVDRVELRLVEQRS